tara:strand:- start:1071 stop:1694 length:624 start_codon:yes stop_codon:yes gene_type:complete
MENFSYTGFNNFDRILIKMLDQSYKSPNTRNHIGDWKYNSSISNETAAIFINDNKKEAVYAIKGTSNKKELLLDLKLSLFTNIFSNKLMNRTQMNKSLEHFRRVSSILNNRYKIFITGHSLGGIKALYISKTFPAHTGTIFNTFVPGTMKPDLRLLFTQNRRLKMVIARGDILSNNITLIRRDVVSIVPPLLKQSILSHSISELKKY